MQEELWHPSQAQQQLWQTKASFISCSSSWWYTNSNCRGCKHTCRVAPAPCYAQLQERMLAAVFGSSRACP
jgi:hypothetical protein